MELIISELLYAVSDALDCLEKHLTGIESWHSQRVAYLSAVMAERMGIDSKSRVRITETAVLHDNALSNYMTETVKEGKDGRVTEVIWDKDYLEKHCLEGEDNMEFFPFVEECRGTILYHHERADGMGPFRKRAGEVPVSSRLIHLSDSLDVLFGLQHMTRAKYEKMRRYVDDEKGRSYDPETADAFLEAASYDLLSSMEGPGIRKLLMDLLPVKRETVTGDQLIDLSCLFARIIDYKSDFTCVHSMGIAHKAMEISKYYGWDLETQEKMFFAGALHDIGKLMVSSDILEKPDKLTDVEYGEIKNHAMGSYRILSSVSGLEDITSWACLHHEKLDGSGYPFGKTADELGMKERLMACLDIYQALTEERPYKEGLPHSKVISMMESMASNGKLDGQLVRDVDICFK